MCNCGCGLALAMAELELKEAAGGAPAAAGGVPAQAVAIPATLRGWEAIKQVMRRIVAHDHTRLHETATPDLTAA